MVDINQLITPTSSPISWLVLQVQWLNLELLGPPGDGGKPIGIAILNHRQNQPVEPVLGSAIPGP